jgi:dTDP-4-dehydrorhamnose reductase
LKILTLGNGFAASHFPYETSKFRITPNENAINAILDFYKPNVIVNCAGKTGQPNVDQCELIKAETYTANVVIPLMLARECEKRNIHFVHLGSGCINYSTAPNGVSWKEDDFSNPASYYSKTKYAADLALGTMDNVSILRLRMPVSDSTSPRNLLSKLIKYNKVLEEPNSITFMSDLKNAVQFVIDNKLFGIYNITSDKPLTHSVFLEEYKKYVPTHTYEKITVEQLSSMVVATRSNCVLDNSKIKSKGFVFADTDARVREVVKAFVENRNKEIK